MQWAWLYRTQLRSTISKSRDLQVLTVWQGHIEHLLLTSWLGPRKKEEKKKLPSTQEEKEETGTFFF